jgi:hypothetical protein
MFDVGDRVRVISGDLFGRTGDVTKIDGDRVQVRGDNGGKRTFPAASLVLVEVVVDPPPSGGAPPTLAESSNGNGSSAPTAVLTQPVGVDPTPGGGGASTLEDRQRFLYDWLLELEAAGVLNAWIESENRGGRSLYRIVYHKSERKEPRRVSGKHVHNLRQQIERGKLARHVRALLRAIAE